MTPFGDYKRDPTDRKQAFNIVDFIRINWSLVWEMAEYPAPKLEIINDPAFPSSNFYGGMTAMRDVRRHKVVLNTCDLLNDYRQFQGRHPRFVPILWSGPCTIAREILIETGTIPRDQLLTPKNALQCGLHQAYLTWLDAHEKKDPAAMDCLIVQGAIYDYLANLAPKESMETSYLTQVMRAEEENIYPGFFR